jgi:hypothetical protein
LKLDPTGGFNVQDVRRSQFIYTFGPGSLMESREGTRLIPSIKRGLHGPGYSDRAFKENRIDDLRLGKYIQMLMSPNNQVEIFSVPTVGESKGGYATYIFPVWRICYNRNKHPDSSYVLYELERHSIGGRCTVCQETKGQEAVRFVAACSGGHLDEVQWDFAVHRWKEWNHSDGKKYFLWKPGGSSLADIEIRCPYCGAHTDMQKIYNDRTFNCTGRYPETEAPITERSPYLPEPRRYAKKCDRNMKVINRQSASVYSADTVTFLTLYRDEISEIVQKPQVRDWIATTRPFYKKEDPSSYENLSKSLKNSLEGKLEKKDAEVLLKLMKENGYEKLLQRHDSIGSEVDQEEFLYQEFEELINHDTNKSDEYFIMRPPRKVMGKDRFPDFEIYRIERIRTVTALIGYRRQIRSGQGESEEPELTDIGYTPSSDTEGTKWYPGFEGIGEGIMVRFNKGLFNELKGKEAYRLWEEWGIETESIRSVLWGKKIAQPMFVYLHTMSHSIIRALSRFSGYSSASLHERIYIDRNAGDGAILIYNTSPGSEAGMGGLIESVNNIEQVMIEAVKSLKICSNDPICNGRKKNRRSINGSACYSCLLISETSCEYRNMALDRHMVVNE